VVPEAAQRDNGWLIGRGEEYADHEYQDEVESHALYDLLEKEVVPLFYERGNDGYPGGGSRDEGLHADRLSHVQHRPHGPRVHRAVLPAREHPGAPAAEGAIRRRARAGPWEERVREHWPELAIGSVEAAASEDLEVGSALKVVGRGAPRELGPGGHRAAVPRSPRREGEPDAWCGDHHGHMEAAGEGNHVYSGAIPCRTSGQHGYAVRVLPHHENLVTPHLPGLIRWAK